MNTQLLLVFACLILGVGIRKTQRFPLDTPKVLNGFVIWISLPALVYVQISKLLQNTNLTSELVVPVSMAWILFGLSFVCFSILGKLRGWSRKKMGTLILLSGLGNTSFVGFPILESILGPESLPLGILVDQPGSFLVLSTVGIVVASALSPKRTGKVKPRDIAGRVFGFPPFLALLLTFILGALGVYASSPVHSVFERLASTLVPLALVSVGFQLQVSVKLLQRNWKPLTLGLLFKLALAPLFFYFLYWHILKIQSFSAQVTILESAMATMITAGVVAEDFGFESELVSLMLGIGIPLSVMTVPLWDHFLF